MELDDDLKQATAANLRLILHQLFLQDIETMRELNADARKAQREWDSIGMMLDPTAYHKMMYDGSFDESVTQIEIVDKLIEVRELLNEIVQRGKIEGKSDAF